MLGLRLGSTGADRHPPVLMKRARMSLRLVPMISSRDRQRPCAARRGRHRHCRNCRSARRRRSARSGAPKRHRGGEVIDDLRHDARPVDRIHRRQADRRAERRVGEHRLHQVLAIVEGAFDGDGVHVGATHRRHLPALHLGDAALGIEDEDVERARSRQASIAAEPVSPEVAPTMVTPLAAPRQHMVEAAARGAAAHNP